MDTLLERIKTRGWWHVVVHPGRFDEHRIAHTTELLPILERCVVSPRGWEFPHIDGRARLGAASDWIGQEIDWQQYLEIWRFYTSGQFVHIAGMKHDWRDRSQIWPPNENWRPGAGMPLIDTVYRITEIFEFAARLALTDASDATMHVELQIHGLAGRELYDENAPVPAIYTSGPVISTTSTFGSARDYDRADLVARPRAIATGVVRDVLLLFNWRGPESIISALQEELFGRTGVPSR